MPSSGIYICLYRRNFALSFPTFLNDIPSPAGEKAYPPSINVYFSSPIFISNVPFKQYIKLSFYLL